MNVTCIAVLLLAQARPHGVHYGSGGGGHSQGPRTRTIYVPLYGGYYGDYSAPPPAPLQPEPPPVVYNPGYQPEIQNPLLRDYSNAGLPDSPPLEQRLSEPPPAVIRQADPPATIYLIALKDGTMRGALGWWVEGDTLNYITRDGNRNRITLDLVDRELSVRLNAERHLEFKFD